MPVAAGDVAGHRVQRQVGEAQRLRVGFLVGDGATQQRAQPGEQFFERERFGEIVVGAGVESADALGDGVPRGQHQNRQVVAGRSQPPTDLEPVEARHHHIHDGDIGTVGDDLLQCLDTVTRRVDRIAVERQRPSERLTNRPIVVDHKDAHAYSLNRIG